MRALLVAVALMLALAPAAVAQDEDDDGPLVDEPVATVTPVPDPCDRPPGSDGDYAYCDDPCERPAGTDGDYAYCPSSPPPRPRPLFASGPGVKKKAAAQPLAAGTLPVTGSEPLLIALVGLGFLLAGAGLRLSAAAPPRSS